MSVLKITSTPIKLPTTPQRTRLKSRLSDPEVGTVRNLGKLDMKSDHIKVGIDTSHSRDNLGFKTAGGPTKDAVSTGLKAASDVTTQYSRVGNQMMQIQGGVMVSGIIKNQMMAQTNVVAGIVLIPSVGLDISREPADLSIDFVPAQFVLDPQVREPAARYVLGEFSVNVEQYPKVEIEYMGNPVYIPSSVNPVGNEGPQ